MKDNKQFSYIYIILFAVLLFAFSVRWKGAHNGLPYLHHWDEPLIANTSLNMFKNGDLNPHFFPYGGFTIYSCYVIDAIHYSVLWLDKTDRVSLSEIKTNENGNFRELAPSSFLFWNRFLVVLLSTLLIVVVFIISKQLHSAIAGIFTAIILTLSFNFYQHSVFITVDVPVTFWVCCTILMTLWFNIQADYKKIVWALVFAGISMSTKYTAALVLIVPGLALLFHYKVVLSWPLKKLIMLALVPFLVFFVLNPFAVFDFRHFKEDVQAISQVYKTGAGHFSKEPGWEQFSFQLSQIIQDLSFWIVIAALLGIFISFIQFKKENSFKIAITWNTSSVLILIFPVIYWSFMSQQKVAYHRNYIMLYPFFAVYAGYFFSRLIAFFSLFFYKERVSKWYTIISSLLVGGLLVYFYLPSFAAISDSANNNYKQMESRSAAIAMLNDQFLLDTCTNKQVAIAKELRISRDDLKHLNAPYIIFDAIEIDKASKVSRYQLVGNYKSFENTFHTEDSTLNEYIRSQNTIGKVEGSTVFRDWGTVAAQTPITNPEVIILKKECEMSEPLIHISNTLIFSDTSLNIPLNMWTTKEQVSYDNNYLVFAWNATIQSPVVKLKRGNYSIKISAFGTKVNGQNAHFKIMLDSLQIADYYVEEELSGNSVNVALDKDKEIRIYITYDNDEMINGIDRNAWLHSIEISRY